jgi:hypothetical protein
MRIWVGVASLLALVCALEGAARRTPAPQPIDAPPTVFSEARARRVVELIAGRRMIGTPAAASAARKLADELRTLPRVEVDVQEHEGAMPWPIDGSVPAAVHVRNVLARLPGDSAEAILISAHYDGPWESPATADDALSVGVAVETLRALANGPRLPRTVIVALDGGEEVGLVGAAAFLAHPWSKQVAAFVNLEGLPKGPALLFQAAAPPLVEAYARAAPHPYAAVWLQELFQSGVFPNDTNYHAFRDAGLRGLDLCTTDDAWAYHTALDQPARLGRGTPQHMGDDLLATVRELARSPLPTLAQPTVYYDVLGQVMLAYSTRTAQIWMLAALAITALALGLAVRRGRLDARALLVGTAFALASIVAAMAGAVGAAAVLALGLHRSRTWFASPWSGVAAYGLVALAAATAVQLLWARRSKGDERRSLAAWAGAQLVWSSIGAALTLCGIASAYLALWWILPSAIAFAVVIARPRAWPIAWTLGVAPGLMVLAEPLSLFGRLLVPQSWSLGGAGFDLVLAGAIALPLALAAPSLLVPMHRTRIGPPTLALGALALVALTALALRFPYSPERPMRVYAAHVDRELGILGIGAVDLSSYLPEFHRPSKDAIDVLPGSAAELQRTVTSSGAIAPAFEIIQDEPDTTAHVRAVTVHLRAPGASEIDLFIPKDRLAGWSLGELPPLPPDAHRRVLFFFGRDEWTFTLRVRGDGSVPISAHAVYPERKTAELTALQRQLPAWMTVAGVVLASVQLTF